MTHSAALASQASHPIALETTGLAKSYGAIQALRGVDLCVHSGEVLALCGDNGAGKSTLIRVLSGAHEPSAGEVRLFGKPYRQLAVQ